MTDTVPADVRSKIMSKVRSTNTRPELLVRSALHREGLRFRLHQKDLPGRPDIVLPRYRVVIFVHGCFWHQHEGCRYATMPSTNTINWRKKFADNKSRDAEAVKSLIDAGWRVLIFWECALKGNTAPNLEIVKKFLADNSTTYCEIPAAIHS